MKKIGLLFFIAVLLFLSESCTKKEKTFTEQEMQHLVDSIVQIKAKELNQQAKEDLELRLPIELKPKLDSMRHQYSTGFPSLPAIDTSDALPKPVLITNDSVGL